MQNFMMRSWGGADIVVVPATTRGISAIMAKQGTAPHTEAAIEYIGDRRNEQK
jgi:hypothetical protein